ncbi:MAG: LD-carboxypeptidase [Thermoleophilia bacterium]|nr:LD-carboxypeptidase [Thermoleophilia bacterium]
MHERALIRPPRLRRGDTIAIASPSWGGPGALPERHDAGLRQLREHWGLEVVELEHARADPAWIAANPAARADDLHAALRDDAVAAIFTSIGGDDSIRVLPHLDLELIRARPKTLLGFSDTTCIHMAWHGAGVVSCYGGATMCGFAENAGMLEYFVDGIDAALFGEAREHEWPELRSGWTVERLEWSDPANQSIARTLQPSTGRRWLQGAGVVRGMLVPACLEVLDWLRGSPWMPDLEGAVLALETSEEAPTPEAVVRMLRALGATGALGQVAAVLLGRPGGDQLTVDERLAYDGALVQVVRDELGRADVPLVANLDFGHTDPSWTLPVGVPCTVDCDARRIHIGA